MNKLTKQDGSSLDMVNENLEALKVIFPEAFTEGGVDFEVLRQLLGGVAAVAIEDQSIVAEFSSLIDVGKRIPWQVQQVHGITSSAALKKLRQNYEPRKK